MKKHEGNVKKFERRMKKYGGYSQILVIKSQLENFVTDVSTHNVNYVQKRSKNLDTLEIEFKNRLRIS